MPTLPKPFTTPEQYLEIERKAEIKSEYYNGEMFAMSGASRWHGRISGRLTMLVELHLQDAPCEAYAADMRVLTPSGLYTYPDLVVVCDEPKFVDAELDTLTNPTFHRTGPLPRPVAAAPGGRQMDTLGDRRVGQSRRANQHRVHVAA